MKIKFTLNHVNHEVEVDPSMRLLDFLRNEFHALSVKEGCGEGSCGACTVLMDKRPIDSCLCPVANIDGKEIITLDGFKTTRQYRIIADAFALYGGSQCGFCTPGMIISTYGLLLRNPHPTEMEVKEALSGNLCRCTGYQSIVDAVLKASKEDIVW